MIIQREEVPVEETLLEQTMAIQSLMVEVADNEHKVKPMVAGMESANVLLNYIIDEPDISLDIIDINCKTITKLTGIDANIEYTAGLEGVVDSIINFVKAIFNGVIKAIEALFSGLATLITKFFNYIDKLLSGEEKEDTKKKLENVVDKVNEEVAALHGENQPTGQRMEANTKITIEKIIEDTKVLLQRIPIVFTNTEIIKDGEFTFESLEKLIDVLNSGINSTVSNLNQKDTTDFEAAFDCTSLIKKSMNASNPDLLDLYNTAVKIILNKTIVNEEVEKVITVSKILLALYQNNKESYNKNKELEDSKFTNGIRDTINNTYKENYYKMVGFTSDKIFIKITDDKKTAGNITEAITNLDNTIKEDKKNNNIITKEVIKDITNIITLFFKSLNLEVKSLEFSKIGESDIKKGLDELTIPIQDAYMTNGKFERTNVTIAKISTGIDKLQGLLVASSKELNAYSAGKIKVINEIKTNLEEYKTKFEGELENKDAAAMATSISALSTSITKFSSTNSANAKTVIEQITSTMSLATQTATFVNIFENLVKIYATKTN